jgi:hypothetical protein
MEQTETKALWRYHGGNWDMVQSSRRGAAP